MLNNEMSGKRKVNRKLQRDTSHRFIMNEIIELSISEMFERYLVFKKTEGLFKRTIEGDVTVFCNSFLERAEER